MELQAPTNPPISRIEGFTGGTPGTHSGMEDGKMCLPSLPKQIMHVSLSVFCMQPQFMYSHFSLSKSHLENSGKAAR